MHNIKTNFGRFYRICKEFFEDEADSKGNFQFYPKAPVMADLEVISLACVMEALGIDSENLLWSKIRKDYPGMFLQSNGHGFKGVFAPFALAESQIGKNTRQAFVTKRANYIAHTAGKRNFPWRVFIVADEDKSNPALGHGADTGQELLCFCFRKHCGGFGALSVGKGSEPINPLLCRPRSTPTRSDPVPTNGRYPPTAAGSNSPQETVEGGVAQVAGA